MPLPTMNIPDFSGLTHTVNLANSGRQAAADSSAVVLSNEDLAALTASRPVTQSGAWNITNISGTVSLPTGAATSANQTALNALFPSSLGTKTAANSLAVTLASDGPVVVSTGTTADAAWTSGNGTQISLLKAIAANAISTKPSPVVGPGTWETVAASQSAQVLGGAGAIGDYVSHVLIVPATTSPGAVSIQDGAGSAITIFAGGASSVSNLVPFAVPLAMTSLAGAWKVTTGANVSAIGVGLFT